MSPSKFLIYSFTHDTFAVADLTSAAMDIAACKIRGLSENTIVEVVFAEPPTHFWYIDKQNKVHGMPLKLLMNQSESHSDSLAFYNESYNRLTVGSYSNSAPGLPESPYLRYFTVFWMESVEASETSKHYFEDHAVKHWDINVLKHANIE